MKYSAIVPAAGKGERMELGYNKVFHKIGNQTILEKTLTPFLTDPDCSEIIVICAKDEMRQALHLFTNPKIKLAEGGATREVSVNNGLQKVKEAYVLIHDGDRCEVTLDLLKRVCAKLEQGQPSVIPVIPKEQALSLNGRVLGDVLVQTPQGFKTSFIKEAFARCVKENKLSEYVDDAGIGTAYLKIQACQVLGDPKNIKVTVPSDLKLVGGE